MKYILLLLVLINFSSLSVFGENNNDTLKIEGSDFYRISFNLKFFSVGNKVINASLAYRYYTAGKFLPVKNTNNEYVNAGLVSSDTWYALPLKNISDKEFTMVLEFIVSKANGISCYIADDMQQITFLPSSLHNNQQIQKGLLSTSVLYDITMTAQEDKLLLFHCVNKGYLYYVPAYTYNLDYFRDRDVYKNNFLGIFKGIFLFIILFNLIIYISTFDKIYLYYLLYAFFISIFALNDAGAASFNSGVLEFIQYVSGQSYLFLGFTAWLLLMERFIRMNKNNIIIYKLLRILVITDFILALCPFLFAFISDTDKKIFQIFFQNAITIFYAINLLFIIITNISRISHDNKLAIFYAIANIPVIIGTLLYYANYYGITDIQFEWLNPIALGLSIETFILSFGFAYRYNLITKEKTQLLIQVNKQYEETTEQIISTQENERKRIAEDLHDELGSNLAAIKLSVQKLPVEKNIYAPIISMLDEASADVRNISHNLMPPEFTKTKLEDLLSYHYKQLSNEGDIKFTFHCLGYNQQFTKNDELMIYRIVMELTNNIIKHSCATESSIQLLHNDTHLEIIAEDNGRGFTETTTKGIGLKNIRSRIDYLGGTINIDSGNSGTTIIIHIPYKQ